MIIVDTLLAAPFKGLVWLFEEVAQAAAESQTGEAEAIKMALAQLYRQLETGEIDEAVFDAREQQLLDRLDALEPQP